MITQNEKDAFVAETVRGLLLIDPISDLKYCKVDMFD